MNKQWRTTQAVSVLSNLNFQNSNSFYTAVLVNDGFLVVVQLPAVLILPNIVSYWYLMHQIVAIFAQI